MRALVVKCVCNAAAAPLPPSEADGGDQTRGESVMLLLLLLPASRFTPTPAHCFNQALARPSINPAAPVDIDYDGIGCSADPGAQLEQ